MTARTTDRPLATFALFAYNQEKYIREALEGAFSQSYEPLEIILSDDCSTDRTYQIMQEMAHGYTGPHKVVVLRNPLNLGIGKHVNKILHQCTGDWITLAAGDDISVPERVTLTMAHVASKQTRIDGAIVQLEEIDEAGNSTGITHNKFFDDADILQDAIKGAGMMVSRATIELFPQFISGVQNEDVVLSLRAMMLSRLDFVPLKLVKYRFARQPLKGSSKYSFDQNWGQRQIGHMLATTAAFQQMQIDRNCAGEEKIANLQAQLFFHKKAAEALVAQMILNIMTKKNFWSKELAMGALRNGKIKKALFWRYVKKMSGQLAFEE